MTTDNHILALIDAYVAGGLDDAERRSFDAHVASCGDCATALDAARAVDSRLAEAFADALPGTGFEDRLLGALRPAINKPSLRHRLSRPIRHPLVRRIATGVAAAIVVGSVGYGMSVAVERQAKAEVSEDKPLQLKPGIDIVAGTSLRSEILIDSSGRSSPEDDLRRTVQLGDIARQQPSDGREVLLSKEQNHKRSEVERLTEQRSKAVSGRERTVDDLVIQARKLTDNGRYDEAKAVGEQILKLEPRNDYVLGVRPLLLDKANLAAAERDQSGPQAAPNFYDDVLRYPHDWPEGTKTNAALSKTLSDSTTAKGVALKTELAGDADRGGSGPAQGVPRDFSLSPVTPQNLDVSHVIRSTNRGLATSEDAHLTDTTDLNLTVTNPRNSAGASSEAFYAEATPGNGRHSGSSGGAPGEGRGGRPVLQTGVDNLERAKSDRIIIEADVKQLETAWQWSDSTAGNRWYKPQLVDQNTARAGVGEVKLLEKVTQQLAKPADGTTNEFVRQDGDGDGTEVKKSVSVPDGGILLLGGQTLAGELKSPDEKAGAKLDTSAGVDVKEPAGQEAAKRAEGAPPATASPAKPDKPIPPDFQQSRKIIRNGVVTFEVDSFDSALTQVSKLAAEEGGFIATTSSDKLPNGKVRGSVTVRVPPDRLDTLVLKLRGMGDLKTQRISADDVTKRYTDIESQLRAARAMEERILTIIKTGGDVKDLLEAEKQLGVWREKLELLEGEIRYFNNLISLSTLVVDLMERDVRTPTAAFEVETVNTAVETEDVETVRSEVLKAIEQAKGRVIDSDLKKLEAGQLSATIKATVAPDAAGPVIDRLKQLGKVARLDISRKTMTQGGSGPIVPGLRIEKKETQFEIHIYNLANIEPRQTTSLSLAAQDVEATFRQIIDQVKSAGGTIKTSQLNRPKADQTSGTIVFQIPSDKSDVVLGAIRTGVDVMRMDVAINPDTQNTTEAKRGFAVQISSLAHVPARETTTLQVAAANVPAAFRDLLEAANATGGRVLTSQLNEQDTNNVTGQLEFEVPRDKWSAVEAALGEAGMVVSRSVVRSPDTENTVDSKVRLSISLMDEIRLAPRETINATVATRTVPETFNTLLQAAKDVGARVVGSNLNLADRANPSGTLKFATPRENAAKFEQALKDAGLVTSRAIARLPDGPMTVDSKVGYIVTVLDERTLRPRESHQMVVVAPSAADRYAKLLDALRLTDALVLNSQLSVQNKKEITGTLEFIVDRQARDAIERALSEGADVFNRTIERSQDTQGTVDTKVRYGVTIKDADQQPPRQTFTLGVETSNIDKAVGDLETTAIAVGGRKLESERARGDHKDIARVVVDVPMARVAEVIASVRGQGEVTVNQSQQNENVPEGSLSRARVAVTFTTPPTVATEKSFGESLREGLSGALTGLFKVVQWVIFGLIVIVPCLLLVWLCYIVIRMTRPRKKKVETVPPADTYGPTPNPT